MRSPKLPKTGLKHYQKQVSKISRTGSQKLPNTCLNNYKKYVSKSPKWDPQNDKNKRSQKLQKNVPQKSTKRDPQNGKKNKKVIQNGLDF